ncbi:hypothetical protein ALC56_05623, partial [Trachymyrmex septentrionalis]
VSFDVESLFTQVPIKDTLNIIKSQHPNIHFTIDIEENGKLPFLDVLVSKKADGTLGHQVYRKPTHTDTYMHPSQKQSVINSLVHRAFTISDKEHLQRQNSTT